jgi:hypothetical protein
MAKYNDYYDVELVQVMPFIVKYQRNNGYVEALSEGDLDVLLGKKAPSFRITKLCYDNRVISVDENLDIAYNNDAFLLLSDDDFVLWAKCVDLAAVLGRFYGQAQEFSVIDLECLKVWDRNQALELYQRLEHLSVKVTKVRAIYNVNNIREYRRLFYGKWITCCEPIEVTEYYVSPMLLRCCVRCRRVRDLLIKTANYILEDYEQEELKEIKRVN